MPRQGLVCSILQRLQSVPGHQPPPLLQTSPLQHCTQTLHGVMPGWSPGHMVTWSTRHKVSRQMWCAVSKSCRHSHDFMQTEHYTGINYCYKNNQVRRIIYNCDPSSSSTSSIRCTFSLINYRLLLCIYLNPDTPLMSCAPGV